jgi:hypothetical protein
MKTHPSLLVLTILLFAAAGLAQTAGSSSGSSQSSAQTGSSSGTSGSMASQAGSQTAGSDTEQMMEGCIIREQQDYFLEPINGQEVHLSGPDVAQHVNHQVRIHGNQQPSQSSSSGSTGSMAGASSSASGSAANAPEFLVTRVDMVSASCPANLRHRSTSSGSQTTGSGNTQGTEPGPK